LVHQNTNFLIYQNKFLDIHHNEHNIMKVYNTSNRKKDDKRKGVVLKKESAIVNKLIDKIPIELHLLGYNFCSPDTKLAKRLARGDSGVNLLDSACKVHDISGLQMNIYLE
jgi:hypothetical protein